MEIRTKHFVLELAPN